MRNLNTLPGFGDPITWSGRTPYDENAEAKQIQIEAEAERQKGSMLADFMPQDLQDVFDKMTDNEQCIFALQTMVAALQNQPSYSEFWAAFEKVAIDRAELAIHKLDADQCEQSGLFS